MIFAQTDTVMQEELIERYMLLPNQVWDDIISQASKVNIKKQEIKEQQKRQNKSVRSNEGGTLVASTKPCSREKRKITKYQQIKTTHK